jgi:PmbA protein
MMAALLDRDSVAARLADTAERALRLMRARGFDHAQVSASVTQQDEVNFAHDEASLLRSTETQRMSLLGLVDGRKASTELTAFDETALGERIAALIGDARSAPQDDANAVSEGERSTIVQGPQQGDLDLLADKVRELLAFRARETPLMRLEEGCAAHTLRQARVLTSGGSDLALSVGWYSMAAIGTARDGKAASSFNHAGGSADELAARSADGYFGIGDMLRDTVRQIHARPLGERFVGEVVLTPAAVADVLEWLQGQIGDLQLIDGSSLYREQVGSAIASPLLTLRSRFDGPGVAAISADAFRTRPIDVLAAGTLKTLTPSLYASRKTGLPHVPVADGWQLDAGATPLADMLAAVPRGALVGRLSMGRPAANGEFSGVIKNSFRLDGGALGAALSETMISGNMARLLRDVSAVSRERLDTGSRLLPWLRVGGLHFS